MSAAPDDEVWVLDPIVSAYSDDPSVPDTDVFVPLQLFDDTAGGFWANSNSTYLHFGATGELINRVDWPALDAKWTMSGKDSITPSRIAVGAVWSDGDLFGDILVLDLATREQSVVHHQESPVGNLAVSGDTVVFISYSAVDVNSFEIRRVSLTTGEVEYLAKLDGAGAKADVDVDADGAIYVASNLANITLDSGGHVLDTVSRKSENPQVAVSPSGNIVWIDNTADAATPFRVVGGSAKARAIITQNSTCGDIRVSVVRDGNRKDLAALCRAAGIVWAGNDTVVISVGSEDGAPLIKISSPAITGSESPDK